LLNKKILVLTSTNLACNPRCLKEVKLLVDMGATVTVVAFKLHNWTTEKEREINNALPAVNFHYLEATRNDFLTWFLSSIIHKAGSIFSVVFPSNLLLSAMAISKRSWVLFNYIRKAGLKPDLIIAHNPPAFYPAYRLAKNTAIPFALDIEDYHPGEGTGESLKKSVTQVMKQLMPLAVYNSFASPLIKEHSEKLLINGRVNNGLVINNVFANAEFDYSIKKNTHSKLQLVWFSQFIDYGRGLEKILPALDKQSNGLTLTLIGNLRTAFFTNEISSRKYIHCIDSMSQKELHLQLSQYDAGLAIEDAGSDFNRDICLTNKIWSYFQAGLYIIASDTTAQQLFISQYAQNGICISLDAENLDHQINSLLQNKQQIRIAKSVRIEQAASVNWENESAILKQKWNDVLQ
jgi:hypothetical protein